MLKKLELQFEMLNVKKLGSITFNTALCIKPVLGYMPNPSTQECLLSCLKASFAGKICLKFPNANSENTDFLQHMASCLFLFFFML